MTEFFHYDDLTWPEVAELPRDVPLVLPLGSSFAPEKVAAQLGSPQRFGILPSIPFGWRGGRTIHEWGTNKRIWAWQWSGYPPPKIGVKFIYETHLG